MEINGKKYELIKDNKGNLDCQNCCFNIAGCSYETMENCNKFQVWNEVSEGNDAPAGGLSKHAVMKPVCSKCKAENVTLINGCCYGCNCLQG
jgi:hypothetical protein